MPSDQLPPVGWQRLQSQIISRCPHMNTAFAARRLEKIIRQGTGRPLDEQIERAVSILRLREAMSDLNGGMEVNDAFVKPHDYEALVAGALIYLDSLHG